MSNSIALPLTLTFLAALILPLTIEKAIPKKLILPLELKMGSWKN
jgi:hypothetical protein